MSTSYGRVLAGNHGRVFALFALSPPRPVWCHDCNPGPSILSAKLREMS